VNPAKIIVREVQRKCRFHILSFFEKAGGPAFTSSDHLGCFSPAGCRILYEFPSVRIFLLLFPILLSIHPRHRGRLPEPT